MSTELQEYIDEQTGTRMTVETAEPYSTEQPRITIYPPEPCTLTTEEIQNAVYRLKEQYRTKGQDREAFEKAITVEGLYTDLTRIGPASRDAGEYANVIVQTCWRVWQLALAYEHEPKLEQLAKDKPWRND